MDHTHIVQAGDLDRYAPTRDSQSVVPELVYLLVKQSCSNFVICRIPYGEAVNQPGWDGMVETEDDFLEFVPKGKSYWEIGTGADPQTKATNDFRKRTEEIDDNHRAESSFVFVTPRSSGSGGWNEPEQTKWLERRKNEGWKLIRIIDGVKLADWLREYPAIGNWMAKKMNLIGNLGGLSTATEHWNDLISECAASEPPFPPKLFTIGRSAACEALKALFEGKMQTLMLFAESTQDVADFVSAFLTELETDTSRDFSNRCLFISDEQAWRSIAETRSPHVLVADPRLGLETEEGAGLQRIARRKGHSLIIPLCGAWSGENPEIIKLRSPSQSQIASVLKEVGYTDVSARELARIGGDRISALLRHLRGYGTLPTYATWDNATLIAQAGLVGNWDGTNPADRSALEIFLGKDYGEWIEILIPDAIRSDSPLIQTNEKWRFVARGEAWTVLGKRVTNDDLDRFRNMAITVLSERDPKFDLAKEERYAASIHGKELVYSPLIRNGIAETLALIGSRSKYLTLCSDGKAESTALLIVRELLNKANWERWASLDSVMPLLAEAAPDEFLDAVESVLIDVSDTPFHKIFAEEEGHVLGGGNYMTGLLWALETLAWSPSYISRVAIILADIASFDPGGNWSNRPANSLTDIFLPWHVQTTSSFEKCKSVIEAVIKEQPDVGWKLLLTLLPHSHATTSGCHRPVWRDFLPRDWKEEVSNAEYWRQITTYTDLAIVLARSETGKLCELLDRLSDLPKSAQESIIEHLNSDLIALLPEADRLPIWEKLDAVTRHHRKFSDADWALAEDTIEKLENAAQVLTPLLPEFKYRYLFNGRDFDLYDEADNYEQQRKRLDEARQTAITEVVTKGGDINSALSFAATVGNPSEVGRALGEIASNEMEEFILPSLLNSENDIFSRVVEGFIWTRFWKFKMEWVDAVLKRTWTLEHQAKFLTLLPFEEDIWERVSSSLTISHEFLYWRNARVNPYGRNRDLNIAIKKLLNYGREGAAVNCIASITDDAMLDLSLAVEALLAVTVSNSALEELDKYQTVELIKRLQKSKITDKDALFRVEWYFLPWLDKFSTGSPVTLEKRLASDPRFFAEVIRLVFHSKNSSDQDNKELSEQNKSLAKNAYKLLRSWKRCPGLEDDGTLNVELFNSWLNEARLLTEETGHAEIAQIQIGHVLTYAPPDPDGLWIHEVVATALNFRDTGEMRSGFTNQLFNDRGTHGYTYGEAERELARLNYEKAELLDSRSYTRFATSMREFAAQYERQAELEAKRGLFDD